MVGPPAPSGRRDDPGRAVLAAREAAALRSRCCSARRSAGGIVRVRRPYFQEHRPSPSCRMTTRLASQARRRDVSAETWLPSSSTDWPGCSAPPRRVQGEDHCTPPGAGPSPGSERRLRALRRPVWARVGGSARLPCRPSPVAAPAGTALAAASMPHEQRAHLRRQPPADDHRAVLVRVHVERPARVLPRGLPGLGLPVHAPPAPHDPLDVRRRAGPSYRQQPPSVSGVATRVRARTLAYESSPRARPGQRAAASPRAAPPAPAPGPRPRSSPTRQLSQAAQERNPLFQPPRASNSRIRSSRRAVAASRCADSSAISSPSRSRSATTTEPVPRPAGLGLLDLPGLRERRARGKRLSVPR